MLFAGCKNADRAFLTIVGYCRHRTCGNDRHEEGAPGDAVNDGVNGKSEDSKSSKTTDAGAAGTPSSCQSYAALIARRRIPDPLVAPARSLTIIPTTAQGPQPFWRCPLGAACCRARSKRCAREDDIPARVFAQLAARDGCSEPWTSLFLSPVNSSCERCRSPQITCFNTIW